MGSGKRGAIGCEFSSEWQVLQVQEVSGGEDSAARFTRVVVACRQRFFVGAESYLVEAIFPAQGSTYRGFRLRSHGSLKDGGGALPSPSGRFARGTAGAQVVPVTAWAEYDGADSFERRPAERSGGKDHQSAALRLQRLPAATFPLASWPKLLILPLAWAEYLTRIRFRSHGSLAAGGRIEPSK